MSLNRPFASRTAYSFFPDELRWLVRFPLPAMVTSWCGVSRRSGAQSVSTNVTFRTTRYSRILPLWISTFWLLIQAPVTFFSVLFARSIPLWSASSKLTVDEAMISETLATDMDHLPVGARRLNRCNMTSQRASVHPTRLTGSPPRRRFRHAPRPRRVGPPRAAPRGGYPGRVPRVGRRAVPGPDARGGDPARVAPPARPLPGRGVRGGGRRGVSAGRRPGRGARARPRRARRGGAVVQRRLVLPGDPAVPAGTPRRRRGRQGERIAPRHRLVGVHRGTPGGGRAQLRPRVPLGRAAEGPAARPRPGHPRPHEARAARLGRPVRAVAGRDRRPPARAHDAPAVRA